ncbi:hypothetical protein BK133_11090 [Paenibacillus sp. FSL H8-0548]|uniref:hypothetical protein n=1 Tax=Paenibacillus sp. FSL H8-0548 TaxID=1920422 RepID=UPI00096C4FA7|nr:hypothetical protein [Paenibacillus sp. FSL H8-0548]OMF35248.1 hypothetical protein BK133_11090 [Paenibacillus sp. FSL H8-0548]
MVILVPAMKILGIAIASDMASRFMEERGHGGKVVFVKVVAHVACAYIVLDLLRGVLRHAAHIFGVVL